MGELHARSVNRSCLRWSSDGSGVTLWPNVAFLPKVLSSSYMNQPIQLSRFEPPLQENALELLCPVQALKAYVDATAGVWQGEQLFVCYAGPRKGCVILQGVWLHHGLP